MAKKTTRASDIAKRAGVSPATVSLVLNNRKGISEAVAERVQQIAFEMGYHKACSPKVPLARKIIAQVCILQIHKYGNSLNVQLPSDECFTAGIMDYSAKLQGENAIHLEIRNVDWDLSNIQMAINSALGNFSGMLEQGKPATLASHTNGENLAGAAKSKTEAQQYLAVKEDSHEGSSRRSKDYLKSGLLVVATDLSAEDIFQLAQNIGLPSVFIDSPHFHLPYDFVNTNNTGVIYEIVRQLKSQNYQRLAYVQITQELSNYISRGESLSQATRTYYSGSVPLQLCFDLNNMDEKSLETQLQQLHKDIGEAHFPDAFICSNDIQAYYVIRVVQQMGYRVPQDIAVVGFENLASSAFFTPPLSSVSTPRREVGGRALQRLLEKINARQGDLKHSHSIISQQIGCRYISRESSIRQ